MALNGSGPISIGGATAGQSINLELGRAATATSNLNETGLRTLAGIASGAISLSNFWGKSSYLTDISRILWGGNNDAALSVVVDDSGNIYLVGHTNSMGFGSYDGFIAKLSSSGNLQWQKHVGTSGIDYFYYAFHDSSGNIYISTYTNRIVKMNSAGNILWQKTYTVGVSSVSSRVISVDPSDVPWFATSYSTVFALLKLNPSTGAVSETHTLLVGGSLTVSTYGCCVDSSGNIYAAGTCFDYSVLVGKSTSNYRKAFVFKYNSSGVLQWQRALRADSTHQYFYSVAVDSSGNVFTCGDTAGKFHLSKWNSSGTLQWQRYLGNGVARAVAVDATGNVYVGGSSTSIITGTVGLIAKYNTSGTIQWQRRVGPTVTDVNDIKIKGSNLFIAINSAYPVNSGAIVFSMRTDGTTNPINYNIYSSSLTSTTDTNTAETTAYSPTGTSGADGVSSLGLGVATLSNTEWD